MFKHMAMGLAALALVIPVTPGHAATAVTDLAAPRWYFSNDPARNALDCTAIRSGSCSFRIGTTTTQPGCATETITPPGVTQVDTLCSATIIGTVTATNTPVGCQLTALNSLTVTFNSGVTSVLNGRFTVSGTFKPMTLYPITRYLLTIKGSAPLEAPATGVGTIAQTFTVKVNGIPKICNDPDPDYNGRKGVMTPYPTNGRPTITIAI